MGMLSVSNNSRICEVFYEILLFCAITEMQALEMKTESFIYLLSLILLPNRNSFKSGPVSTGQI